MIFPSGGAPGVLARPSTVLSVRAPPPGAILEPDADDAALSLELHPWPPDYSVAQSLSAMADRDLHRRQNDPDWIPGILGILVDRTNQPVAIPEVDSGDGSLRPSEEQHLAFST